MPKPKNIEELTIPPVEDDYAPTEYKMDVDFGGAPNKTIKPEKGEKFPIITGEMRRILKSVEEDIDSLSKYHAKYIEFQREAKEALNLCEKRKNKITSQIQPELQRYVKLAADCRGSLEAILNVAMQFKTEYNYLTSITKQVKDIGTGAQKRVMFDKLTISKAHKLGIITDKTLKILEAETEKYNQQFPGRLLQETIKLMVWDPNSTDDQEKLSKKIAGVVGWFVEKLKFFVNYFVKSAEELKVLALEAEILGKELNTEEFSMAASKETIAEILIRKAKNLEKNIKDEKELEGNLLSELEYIVENYDTLMDEGELYDELVRLHDEYAVIGEDKVASFLKEIGLGVVKKSGYDIEVLSDTGIRVGSVYINAKTPEKTLWLAHDEISQQCNCGGKAVALLEMAVKRAGGTWESWWEKLPIVKRRIVVKRLGFSDAVVYWNTTRIRTQGYGKDWETYYQDEISTGVVQEPEGEFAEEQKPSEPKNLYTPNVKEAEDTKTIMTNPNTNENIEIDQTGKVTKRDKNTGLVKSEETNNSEDEAVSKETQNGATIV